MIIKELDSFASSDKFQIAGRKAEEQMAHYLRRFFGSSTEVDVLNYLRVELAGEVAQMDHLVLHPYGLLIVESKSVAGSVQIKDDGQWIRWFAKQPQGMRSPVTQAALITDSQAITKVAGALPEKVCKYCHATKVELRSGQFGYYLACGGCSKNTPLRFACPQCGGDGRIRKQGREFFAGCRACDASKLFHTNES